MAHLTMLYYYAVVCVLCSSILVTSRPGLKIPLVGLEPFQARPTTAAEKYKKIVERGFPECVQVFLPVCATDGKTYINRNCMLMFNPNARRIKDGPCEVGHASTSDEFDYQYALGPL